MENQIEGFLLLNKPTGMTSFTCVRQIRDMLPKKTKVGHAGTLDSFATGLLILAINRTATRHINSLIRLDKWYIATGKLGQLTDTLDFTGMLLEDEEPKDITAEKIKEVLPEFQKDYTQIPPVFSALKYKGRRLSHLARIGKLDETELQKVVLEKAKKVEIFSLELIKFEPPYFTVKVHVSHGTYIRTLINDIGKKLGTYATTHELERTKIGPFSIEKAVPLRDLSSEEDIEKHVVPIGVMWGKLREYLNLQEHQ